MRWFGEGVLGKVFWGDGVNLAQSCGNKNSIMCDCYNNNRKQ